MTREASPWVKDQAARAARRTSGLSDGLCRTSAIVDRSSPKARSRAACSAGIISPVENSGPNMSW